MTTDIKSVLVWYPEQLRTPYMYFGKVLRNAYGALTYPPTKLLVPLPEQHRIASHSVLVTFQIAEVETPCSRIPTLFILVCPTEHFRGHSRKFLKILATGAIRSTYKLSLIF